jgi:hypothetical protein
MQSLVYLWCHLIGIRDAASIQIASGVMGVASLLIAVYVIVMLARKALGRG